MERTEEKMIEVFGELLEEMPLNKITVRKLVERCGVNRNTFYYHFEDIPSLLERILKDRADQMIANHGRPGTVLECICLLADYGQAHKEAALHIYHSLSREAFVRNLEKVAEYIVAEYVDSAAAGIPVQPSDRNLLVRYYKCVFVGVMTDWFNDKMHYDLRAAAQRACYLMAGSVMSAFEKSAQDSLKP